MGASASIIIRLRRRSRRVLLAVLLGAAALAAGTLLYVSALGTRAANHVIRVGVLP